MDSQITSDTYYYIYMYIYVCLPDWLQTQNKPRYNTRIPIDCRKSTFSSVNLIYSPYALFVLRRVSTYTYVHMYTFHCYSLTYHATQWHLYTTVETQEIPGNKGLCTPQEITGNTCICYHNRNAQEITGYKGI
jgi:hypothetical protein